MSNDIMRTDYSVNDVVERVKAVNELYKSVMQVDQHYGVIPGAGNKPTLLKAGAEKVCAMFSLSPKTIDKQVRDMPNGHREIIITIELVHRKTGESWGDGSGSCSTLEKKYRWRDKCEPVRPVPKEYWASKDPAYLDGMKTKKIDGQWMLCHVERMENEDIADMYNTVLKMAEKRALVSAVLKATGVSDIFTQDIEDMDLGVSAKEVSISMESTEKRPTELPIALETVLDMMSKAKNKQDLGKIVNKSKLTEWTDEQKVKLNECYLEKIMSFDKEDK